MSAAKYASAHRLVVIGGGHAGVEAAAAAARLGVRVALVTLRRGGIGQMSCNPAIGGLGKGQLVKEVDALGGLMGRAIDATGIQFRTLNSSKGPAVRASRAQADRDLYKGKVLSLLEAEPLVEIVEGEAASIEVNGASVSGITLADGSRIPAAAVVLTTGTFLRGLMHTGAERTAGGRQGDKAASNLSAALERLGFSLGRLKTGTPPRLRKSTIDFASLTEQPGDEPAPLFSMMSAPLTRSQISCWTTSTNEAIHEIIRANRERSPMFNGQIRSGGPRYCPSIEDKVFRFADKSSHTVFLEPEGFESDIVYPNGISTSLPYDVQHEFVRLIPGLERVEILQPGYAVEYDFVNPQVLGPTLETKLIAGLYFAGQINGTSGYEEAAGQGLVAGANAALGILGRDPLVITRGEGYLGVMIDDLITNGVDEPYRMFTSRAEYRLVLREDNSPDRMCPRAIACGLLPRDQQLAFEKRQSTLEGARGWLASHRIKPSSETNGWLAAQGSAPLKDSITLATLVRRPEMTIDRVLDLVPYSEPLAPELRAALEIETKFSGYLVRQDEDIRRLQRAEEERIPSDFNYDEVPSLRVEAREKLKRHCPVSLGQAMRIPGITPSTISVLSIFLARAKASGAAPVTGTDCA